MKKQKLSHQDFVAIKNSSTRLSKNYIDNLIDDTIFNARKIIGTKSVGVAYSTGKDSIVLRFIMDKINDFPKFLVINNLEYPKFIDWLHEFRKTNTLDVVNTGQDLEWLSEHEFMLFPNNSMVSAKWFHIVQHAGQNSYYHGNNLDIICLGRRTQDGNYCGVNGLYENSSGVVRYSPIMNWTHEDVFACIHYYELEKYFPPFYSWPEGFRVGTGPWAKRRGKSHKHCWDMICSIDKTILGQAVAYLKSAREYHETSAQ